MTKISVWKESISIHLEADDNLKPVDFQGLANQDRVQATIECIGCLSLGTGDALESEQDDARPRLAKRLSETVIFVCDGRKSRCRRMHGNPPCDSYPVEPL